MNEKKKIIIVIAVLLMVCSSIPIFIYSSSKKQEAEIKKFTDALTSETPKAIYIGREGCTYCQLFSPVISELSEKYEFEYVYIDTDIISDDQLDNILDTSEVAKDTFGTPTILVTQGGKVIARNVGFLPEDDLFNFFKENGVISTSATLSLNYLNYQAYEQTINSSSKQIVVIGQSTCGYCIQAHPSLVKIVDNYKVKINYLNVTKLTEEENTSFTSSLSYLSENNWGTPLMLVVQNKNVVDHFSGAGSLDDYVQFLKKNGFIE